MLGTENIKINERSSCFQEGNTLVERRNSKQLQDTVGKVIAVCKAERIVESRGRDISARSTRCL